MHDSVRSVMERSNESEAPLKSKDTSVFMSSTLPTSGTTANKANRESTNPSTMSKLPKEYARAAPLEIVKSSEVTVIGQEATSASARTVISNSNLKCVLYKFPLELRRELYKAILAVWNAGENNQGHSGEIGYIVDALGRTFPRLGRHKHIQGNRIWAGIGENYLPAFELALLPELNLHNEFVTTRVEISVLTLTPSVIDRPQLGLLPSAQWPSILMISPKLRGMVQRIVYKFDLGHLPEPYGDVESDFPGQDCWNRMRTLGNALNKLLLTPKTLARIEKYEVQSRGDMDKYDEVPSGGDMDEVEMRDFDEELINYTNKFGEEDIDKDADEDADEEGSKVLFPHLRKIIIRFPDASRDATEIPYVPQSLSYKHFHDDQYLFWRHLKKFLAGAKLKSLQLEDLRDFEDPGRESVANDGNGEGGGEGDGEGGADGEADDEGDDEGDDENVSIEDDGFIEGVGYLPDVDYYTSDDDYYGEQWTHDLMDDGAPRFSVFTEYLNKALGVECEDNTEIDHEDKKGRGKGWEVYKAKETWTAKGDYLVWTDPKIKKDSEESKSEGEKASN